jgi:hypothetical protein
MAKVEDITQLFLDAFQSLSPQGKQDLLDKLCRLPEKTRARIPGEISLAHYTETNKILLDVLNETNAMQVVARLNETGREEPAPVFIGWVENPARTRLRLGSNDPAPALLRAGDTASSTTYEKCFYNGSVERDWTKPDHVQERRSNELCLSQKAGVNYLRVIRIEVTGENKHRRGVGVLGVGFSTKPEDLSKVDDVLRMWAQSDRRELVPYLVKNFELGGRVL